LNADEGNRHKNDGLEPKYRFGFLLMYKSISRKIIGLRRSTDLYLFKEMGRKMMG